MSFAGITTALITPFKEGKLDEKGLRENISFQIEEGFTDLVHFFEYLSFWLYSCDLHTISVVYTFDVVHARGDESEPEHRQSMVSTHHPHHKHTDIFLHTHSQHLHNPTPGPNVHLNTRTLLPLSTQTKR